MSTARLLIGDVFDRMAEIEDGSVDLVVTSPPFLALRSYLPPDHPDKGKEIGSEPTPAAFIDTMLRLAAEWRRVLAPHGSICVELGDTYCGAGGYGSPDSPNPAYGKASHNARFEGRTTKRFKRKDDGWPLAKSLVGIPHLFHLSLAYGHNLLTGEPSPAGQWRVRNVVAWCRPNPPVGALGDKFRPATSYMTVACVSGKRWFDLDAVRTPPKNGAAAGSVGGSSTGYRGITQGGAREGRNLISDPAGAPPLDWWEIPTQPYKGSHYATWPEALCVRPILSMCPERVCRTCGKPSERITSTEQVDTGRTTNGSKPRDRSESFAGTTYDKRTESLVTTLGWTDCGHDDWRPGVVLDPFAGSGTTLKVAIGHGRDAIGIDIDARNADLVAERVGGLFLEVT